MSVTTLSRTDSSTPTAFLGALDSGRFHGLHPGTPSHIAALHQAVTLTQAELLAGGRAPLLSESQALDSPLLVAERASRHRDALLELVASGHIRVALRPDRGGLTDAFVTRLELPGFTFATWPELNPEADGSAELRTGLAVLCRAPPSQQNRLLDRIVTEAPDCAARAEALLDADAAVTAGRAITKHTERPRREALAEQLTVTWEAMRSAGWGEDHPLAELASHGVAERSSAYARLDAIELEDPERSSDCADARELVDACYQLVTGRFTGAGEHLATLPSTRLRELLEGSAALTGETSEWTAAPAPDTGLRPIDWIEVRDFLRRHADAPVAERRRIAEAEDLLRAGGTRQRTIGIVSRLHPLIGWAVGAAGEAAMAASGGMVGVIGPATALGWELGLEALAQRTDAAAPGRRGSRGLLLRERTPIAGAAA